MKRAFSILTVACLLAPSAALAHTGAGATDGIVHGLMHPVAGLDHVLAMVAVTGIGLGLGINHLASRSAIRFAQAGGVAIALAGIALLARSL